MAKDAKQDPVKTEKPKKKPGRIRRGLGWTFKPMVDVKGWIGFNSIKQSTHSIVSLAQGLFTPQEGTREETFEEALQRLNVTEDVLKQRVKQYSLFVWLFVLMALCVLCYAIYLIFYGSLSAFLVSMVLCCIILTQAFRFHFWIFQVKHRKLGCDIREWYQSKVVEKSND